MKKPSKQPTKKKSLPTAPPGQKTADDDAPSIAEKPVPCTKLEAFFIPALFLLTFVALWFVPPVEIKDPWDEAISLVNAARKTKDPGGKQALLDQAGTQLRELVRRHPYHARVHFVLAYYYDDAGDYDASIVQAKEAIRLGSGATVNQVDGIAKEVLVDAALKKADLLIARQDYAAARTILDDAYAVQPESKALLASLGNLAIKEQSWASARSFLEQLIRIDPKNDEVYWILGPIAVAQAQAPAAIVYLEKSLAINPRRAAAQDLLARLKSSSAAGGGPAAAR
jgi:tetratricopeptide (TPR) repeat protein